MNKEFEVKVLNPTGVQKAKDIAEAFDTLLNKVVELTTPPGLQAGVKALNTRELAIVRTKLEEASFFAKKAMSLVPEYQKTKA